MELPVKEMNTSKLIIQPNGSCFLCSEQVASNTPLHDEEPRPSKLIAHSIQNLSEYLELDIGTVLKNGKSPIPPWLLDQMKSARLEVALCGNCIKLNDKFLELFGQLEEKEVEMKSCLNLINWKLSDARRNVTTENEYVQVHDVIFISSAGPRFKMKLDIQGILRWEAFQKCSRKVNMGSPRVKLQKLSRKVVTEMTNFGTRIMESIPTDNDCIDLPDYDSNVPENDGVNEHVLTSMDDDFSVLSDGEKDGSFDNEDDYLPENGLQRSTRQNKYGLRRANSKIKVNQSTNWEQTQTGGEAASKINCDRKYPKPIIIYVSKSKSAEHAKTSSKKWTFITATGKYKCSLCPKMYATAQGISSHYKSVHLKIRYKCADVKCGKLFCYLRNFHRHVEANHLHIRFECPFCKEKITRNSLYAHKKRFEIGGICFGRKPKNNLHQNLPKSDNGNPPDDLVGSLPDNGLSADNQLSGENEAENSARLSISVPSTLKDEFKDKSPVNRPRNSRAEMISNPRKTSLLNKSDNYATPLPSTSEEESKDLNPANQRKNQRAKTVRNGSQNQNPTRKTSMLNKSGKYAAPIIVHGSKSKSTNQKSFKKYIFNPETRKYKCSLCPKESSKDSHITSHFQSTHLHIRFKCPEAKCGKTFCYRKGYNRHVQFNHLGIRHECPFCKKKVNKGMLYEHRKRYEEVGVCPLPRQKKMLSEQLPNGIKDVLSADDQDCLPDKEDDDQDGNGNSENYLSGEKVDNNAPQPSVPIPSTSKEKFKNRITVKRTRSHRVKLNMSPGQNQSGRASNLTSNGKYSKPIITYVSKSKSVDHAKTSFKKWILIPETGKYKCSICPEECNSAFEVFIHFKCVHLEAHYKCPDAKCGKLFPSLKSYRHHAYLETRYECPFCKEMVKKGNLYWHKKKNEEGGICPRPPRMELKRVLGQYYQQVADKDDTNGRLSGATLNRKWKQTEETSKLNQKNKYPTPIIIYGCKANAEKYAKKSFKKWIFIPKSTKYKCSLCPKEYVRIAETINHFKNLHLQIRYKCPEDKCGKLYSNPRSYNRHAEFVHMGILYECPTCKEKLPRSMLYWHRKKNEEGGNCSLPRTYKQCRRRRLQK